MEGMRFGAWVRMELRRRDLKQSDLARMSGVSRSMISRLITQTENPREKTKNMIIDALERQPAGEQNVNEVLPAEVYARRFADLMKQMIDLAGEILKAMESK